MSSAPTPGVKAIWERSADASPLIEREVEWRDRYSMLESHGYRLRQRYEPDWTPSWLSTKRPLRLHDDYKIHRSAVSIDAIRISDGRRVYLKRIPTSSQELHIHRFLSDQERLQDPHNHTVPLLDVFREDGDPSMSYIVMPFLRLYDFPPFYSVDEVVDFIRQMLEGAVYMHRLNIAHRDCSVLNIMMDADPLYPRGLHPTNKFTDATGYKTAHPKRRRDVASIRYYFIDFGISSMFDANDENKDVIGIDGQDEEVPELSNTVPYDPFLVDVFILGNLFTKTFYEKYENLAFLDPLIYDMTQESQMTRCDSVRALEVFNDILAMQPGHALRWRLKPKSSGKVARFREDFDSILHEIMFRTRSAISSSPKAATQLLKKLMGLNKT